MAHAVLNNQVSVPREEYLRLKEIEKRFGRFLAYVAYVEDIRRAREEVKHRKFIPQERLFKELVGWRRASSALRPSFRPASADEIMPIEAGRFEPGQGEKGKKVSGSAPG